MATKEAVIGIKKRNPAPEGESKCGDCKWLDTAYGGGRKTCRLYHGADEGTEICADFTALEAKDKETIRSLKRHEFIKKALFQLEDPKLDVDLSLEQELVEINNYTKQITDREEGIPVYFEDESDVETLIDTFKQIQAYRERVVSIYTKLAPIQRRLNRLWNMCETYLSDYKVIKEQKNVTERTQALNSILHPIADRLDDIKDILRLADRVDSHLNGCHFALKEIKDIGMRVVELRRQYKRDV